MASLPPKIDRRTYEDIVEQTKSLTQQFTEGKWHPQEEIDAGSALIRIFSRMIKSVSDRLNQVPEKNFLAFLDLIGGELKPPQPAKVPLTFYLATGSSTDAIVPAHTQVSAPPSADSKSEIVFETDRQLIVTTTQLQAVYVREPSQDMYSDRTLAATGQKDEAFLAFAGDRAIEHSLYLTCPEIFDLPEINKLELTITGDTEIASIQNKLEWSYWDSSQWAKAKNPSYDKNDNKFTFPELPILNASEVNGKTAKWLQAKLTNIDSNISKNLPQIANIQGKIDIEKLDLIPEVCLFNNAPLDLSKDFYPFGEQPQLNDTFYIALHDAYIKPNVTINIEIALSHKASADNLEIVWEIGDGQIWQKTDVNLDFTKSNNITATFELPDRNKMPSPSLVNGEAGYWLRARITRGHFGKARGEMQYPVYSDLAVLREPQTKGSKAIKIDSLDLFKINDKVRLFPSTGGFPEEHQVTKISANSKQLTFDTEVLNSNLAVGTRVQRKSIITETIPPTYDPPIVKSLKLTYKFQLQEDAVYFAENDFNFSEPNGEFQPFVTTTDKEPTLYLGFDKSFNNQTVTLYAQVESPSPDELSQDSLPDTKPELVWEYSSLKGWRSLGVKDETQAFSQRGLIQFIAPVDLSQRTVFDRELYWLRVRWVGGNFRVSPRLRRILTNTVWAVQAVSLKEEILGSSNQEASQTFFANNAPILEGQRLEVREAQIPSDLASDRFSVVRDELDEIDSVWVLWQEVADFYSSDRGDRHYVLDRYTGKISFGDGITGMIPPRRRNNIRLSFYRMGGGKLGNVDLETVSQLKTTIPYIDRVINLEAAAGGAAQESLERLKERVPKQLRHRDRAVTIEDLEDLAYEASTDVARVKVVTPDLMTAGFSPFDEFWLDPNQPDITFEAAHKSRLGNISSEEKQRKIIEEINRLAGQVKLIILPNSSDRQPLPSLALLERVKNYILARCEPNIDLVVTAPKWIQVAIETTIVPTSLENANLLQDRVRQALNTFLHPLTGGKDRTGWEFGRRPYDSDFYSIIQSISGVDSVESLKVLVDSEEVLSSVTNKSENANIDNLSLSADTLIYSGNHIINFRQ